MRKTRVVAAVVIVLAAGVAAFVFWQRGQGQELLADPTNTAQVAAGQAIYAANCASCHGDKLQGQPNWKDRKPDGKLPAPPHDASGHTWHHPDQQLFEITKGGVAALVPNYQSDMIGFGDKLSDADIWNVLAYLKSTWPPDIQARQAEMTKRAGEQ